MNSFQLRIKLFLKDKTACLCLILTGAILILVLTGLNIHAAKMSALPVGLLTHIENGQSDETDFTAYNIASRIKANEALLVYEDDYEGLKRLLADGYIYCIIEFDPDIGRMIENGNYKGIMTMHSAKDSPVATIIGDIAAGCAMDEICTNKAYLAYSGLDGDKDSSHLSIDEYRSRLIDMKQSGGYDFVFEADYIDTGKIPEKEITNALIYRQVIAGLTAMLLMLAAFCACGPVAMEYSSGIRERLKITSVGPVKMFIEEALGLFTCCSVLAVLAGVLSAGSFRTALIMSLLNLAVLGFSIAVFYILSNVIKNVLAFQIAGTSVLLLLSGTGFISIFEGLAGKEVFRFTPVAAYIRQYIDLFLV